jgi:MFS family permease
LPTTAAAAAGLVVLALAIGYFVLAGLVHQLTPGAVLAAGPLIVAFGGVGIVVARRQPRNPLGWIMLGCLIVLALGGIAGFYAVLDYRLGHHGLPLAAVAVVLGNSVSLLALLAIPLIIVLFPDGRLPGARWRWVLWAYAGFSACVLALTAAPPIAAVAGHDIRLDSSGNLTTTGQLPGWLDWFSTIVTIAGVAGILLVGVRRQVRNWRQAGGERRQQLKWVAFGGAVSVVWLAGTPVVGNFFFVGLAALPVSMGIAILKYRLYDIDRIISRTLAYAIVTGLLVGLYAGLVLLATEVLRFHSTVAVAASTLAAAALFNPLRRWVQRRVDRRFNRARYDADQTVAAFAGRLKDAVALDSVRDDLTAVVHQALEPAHTSVWIQADERH